MSLLGATVVSVKSGRRWYVRNFFATTNEYVLYPIGDDVRPAQSSRGKFQGGVRRIFVSYERLNDPRFWRRDARA